MVKFGDVNLFGFERGNRLSPKKVKLFKELFYRRHKKLYYPHVGVYIQSMKVIKIIVGGSGDSDIETLSHELEHHYLHHSLSKIVGLAPHQIYFGSHFISNPSEGDGKNIAQFISHWVYRNKLKKLHNLYGGD